MVSDKPGAIHNRYFNLGVESCKPSRRAITAPAAVRPTGDAGELAPASQAPSHDPQRFAAGVDDIA
jgi:hypothetical protein